MKTRQWEKANPEKHYLQQVRARLRKAGIEPTEALVNRVVTQKTCDICESPPNGRWAKRLHIDHCHSTHTFRGLLCDSCNFGLGQFKDAPQLLARAIEYLAESRRGLGAECWQKHMGGGT